MSLVIMRIYSIINNITKIQIYIINNICVLTENEVKTKIISESE